jgi:hypothetical protein
MLMMATCAAPLAAQTAVTPPVVRTLALHGRRDVAMQLAQRGGAPLEVTVADLLVARGDLVRADSLYRDAIARQLPGYRTALAGLAELAARQGNTADAVRYAARAIAGYQAGGAWSGDDLVAIGRADAVLGAGDPQAFHDALRAFDRATAADSSNLDAQVRAADLLLDKYNAPDARAGYTAVLRRAADDPRALYGLARAAAFDNNADPVVDARRALAADAEFVPAWLLLAEQELQAEAMDSATTAARHALALDSSAVTGWGILGAIAWMRGDSTSFNATLAAARKLQPRPADFYSEVAEAAGRQRRYADAVVMARRAVEADSTSARAYGVLGENLLRTGDMVGGRAGVERAFAIDPYNLWHKNMLDLLDNLRSFRTTTTARFQIIAPADESEYLTLYVGPLLEAAYDSFATKYGYHPPTPIRVEYYGRHADFSVRTVGLTGLGALGVSFGTVLVLDSPRAQDIGELNYGSTTWHELAHTFTLGLSDHRVPRWMSEGLSVLEERQAGKGWGFQASPDFLAAYKGGVLPTASRLNEGLVQSHFPNEIGLSYYEASLVMEMIESQHGMAAVRDLLQAYARGLDTPAALQAVLQISPAELDNQFDGWIRARFAAPLAAIDSSDGRRPPTGRFIDMMAHAIALDSAGQRDSAATLYRGAESLFPDDGSEDGAAWHLAEQARAAGDLQAAAADLHRITMHSETAHEANAAEAAVRLQIGDSAGALQALERDQWIDPYQPGLHLKTAELAEALHKYPIAVRERRAIVANVPSDPAEARYQLARTLKVAGDIAGARRELLALLEQAPGFERAQLLLLDLQDGHP